MGANTELSHCIRELPFSLENETVFFWNISCGPLNSLDIEHLKQPPPLSRASKGNDSIKVFLTLACKVCSTHGAKLTCGSDAAPVLLRAVL